MPIFFGCIETLYKLGPKFRGNGAFTCRLDLFPVVRATLWHVMSLASSITGSHQHLSPSATNPAEVQVVAE